MRGAINGGSDSISADIASFSGSTKALYELLESQGYSLLDGNMRAILHLDPTWTGNFGPRVCPDAFMVYGISMFCSGMATPFWVGHEYGR